MHAHVFRHVCSAVDVKTVRLPTLQSSSEYVTEPFTTVIDRVVTTGSELVRTARAVLQIPSGCPRHRKH